ncbi:twin-arginine translocase TatA/TatE family subunit [Deinococcus irradiatisoli]
MPEILLILVAALLIFGPKKLPDLGRSLGNGIREFRKGTQGLKDELEGSFKDEPAMPVTPAPNAQTILAAAPAAAEVAPVNLHKEADAHQA